MLVGLVGVNSQFVHSNLALYYLRETLPDGAEAVILERNQNEPLLGIFYDLVAGGYDLLAFSVYIWNKETVLKLISLVKAALPDCVVVVGGPEPTYAPEDFGAADHIVAGAAETAWPSLVAALARGETPPRRCGGGFASTWPFPYRETDMATLTNRLVYYETSRGCPYRCAFCLSSAERETAFLPLERVFGELDFFLAHRVPVVKLVDRTFNAPPERCKAILRYLIDHYVAGVTFHFELKGELLDEETVALLTAAPADLFQVEIGVQSLNDDALAAVCRQNRWSEVKGYYRRLVAATGLHTHFDLIAGLPYEDITSFKAGFNEVMSIVPDHLQVGFLKLLPGTKLSRERSRYGLVAQPFPPYEVVATAALSVDDHGRLKRLDAFTDNVYNKGICRYTLGFALNGGVDVFDLFLALAAVDKSGYAAVLHDFLPLPQGGWEALLRLDAAFCGEVVATEKEERLRRRIPQDPDAVAALLPHYAAEAPREIYKRIRVLILPVSLRWNDDGAVAAVTAGETRLLLDHHVKGRQKRKGRRPDLIVLAEKV